MTGALPAIEPRFTRLDEFAMAAMGRILSSSGSYSDDYIVMRSYDIAELMLAESKKRNKA